MFSTVVLAVAAVFVVVLLFAAHVDGVALIGPKRTKQVSGPALRFCVDSCRWANGSCPLEAHGMNRSECPLWEFVNADRPTREFGNPFAYLRSPHS